MTDKPRVRVQAGTADSFQNFQARLGYGTGNVADGATYGFNPVSRNRQLLEWAYRGSWIVKQAVDTVAEDMTRAGIEIQTELDPADVDQILAKMQHLCVWQRLRETVKWSRLYGGCIAMMLIDGQRPETPLNIETIKQDQFKGLLVLDRWMINPSLEDPITDYGPGPRPAQVLHHRRGHQGHPADEDPPQPGDPA